MDGECCMAIVIHRGSTTIKSRLKLIERSVGFGHCVANNTRHASQRCAPGRVFCCPKILIWLLRALHHTPTRYRCQYPHEVRAGSFPERQSGDAADLVKTPPHRLHPHRQRHPRLLHPPQRPSLRNRRPSRLALSARTGPARL